MINIEFAVGFMKTFQVKKEDLDDVSIKEEIPTSTTSNHYSCNSAIYHNMPLSFRDNKFYNEDHPCVSLLRVCSCNCAPFDIYVLI